MFERLNAVESRFEGLVAQLGAPEVVSDPARLREVSREHAELEPIVAAWRRYKSVDNELSDAKNLMQDEDPELRAMAKEEFLRLQNEKTALADKLRRLMLPRDPNDSRDVVLEIRKGTGGEEAALFAAELFRMYCRYCERLGWKVEILSSSESGAGGLSEIIALISGKNVYSRLKYESGVHRVQRVPVTESQGRVHTSAVTVAVLPEAEEVDVHIDDRDLHIDVFRSSGPGGQSVNTTDSAVRITHVPSGLVVTCQDEKSQLKNKQKALKVLRARLLEAEQQKADAERSASRRSMVGSGDRSEKVRTYNFPQNRVTDHRIGLNLYALDAIMEGDIDRLLDPLSAHFEAEQLKAQTEKAS